MITPDDLRVSPILEDLPVDVLQWIADHAEEMIVEPGETPFHRGDDAKEMFIVLEGAFQIFTYVTGQRRLFGTIHAGEITGLLPYSRMETYAGDTRILERTRLALVPEEHFPEMLHRSPELGKRLVGLMSDRVRTSTRQNQQYEKLMALGKLSAGLAHELNNPAAAVRRTVDGLIERLEALPELVACLSEHSLGAELVRAANAVKEMAFHRAPEKLSVLEASEREDEVADWLDDHGLPDPYRLAETFAEAGLRPDDLDEIARTVPAEALPAVLKWIEGSLAVQCMFGEVSNAAGRISELVTSIKEYSHMDQGKGREPADLHRGIDSTLTMLGHKLKKKNIQVVKDYQDDLPEVPIYVGELNQVWTNLIDNALDAMGEGGELRLATRREGDFVVADVGDDGPGVPDEIQDRIFEPFFTTKDVGEGTGMGLDIAHTIVTRRHQGQLQLDSRPGQTVFSVRLPLSANGE